MENVARHVLGRESKIESIRAGDPRELPISVITNSFELLAEHIEKQELDLWHDAFFLLNVVAINSDL